MVSVFKGLAVAAALAGTIAVGHSWKASLSPVGESTVSGEATVTSDTPPTDTTQPATLNASINVKGGKSGDALPWHVHSGTCGTRSAPIVGSASDYAPITVGEGGDGTASAKLTTPLAPNGQYIVNVHKSKDDLSVISCGALKAETMPVPQEK